MRAIASSALTCPSTFKHLIVHTQNKLQFSQSQSQEPSSDPHTAIKFLVTTSSPCSNPASSFCLPHLAFQPTHLFKLTMPASLRDQLSQGSPRRLKMLRVWSCIWGSRQRPTRRSTPRRLVLQLSQVLVWEQFHGAVIAVSFPS